MNVIIHPAKIKKYKTSPKIKFKNEEPYYDIILTQQSLPTNKLKNYYYPIVDVSQKFEETIKKCRKKEKLKIKAIEKTTISKNLSKSIIDRCQNHVYRTRFLSQTSEESRCGNNRRASELVDQLLFDIYGRSTPDQKFDTEYCSSTSTSYIDKFDEKLQLSRLKTKDVTELQILIDALTERVNYTGTLLVKQLKKKDALKSKQNKICNVVTAHLQAFSKKTSLDTTMKFSPNPNAGDCGFNQWRDAMKMVAKLPGGIPPEFRKKLWLALAEKHLQSKKVNWAQTEKICFNEWTNPDDSELGIQIVKDLHRTGCSLFCGAAGQENQVLLKRVLLAYARWNKNVGYCQGFNMLAALILQVMDKNETDSVKVMIYLIEGVLPESYFANNLRGLSVDMIVFRDLLKLRLPQLSKHLEALQNDAREGNSYEPPLTNVFTMQWFLTLFCNCLPQSTVLRVWDLIFLEGNEILLRTAIAIWEKLSDRILAVNSADEFYSIMGVLTREMLEFGLVDSNTLIKSIVAIGTCSELNDMRDKYLYNITPWTQSVQTAAKKGFKLFYSDDDDTESDYDEKAAVTAAYGISIGRKKDKHTSNREGTSLQPYTHHPDRERLALDISALKKQYAKLRERQRQAHIILQAACARQPIGQTNSASPIAMNHLLLGKNAIVNSRGRRLGPPKGSIPPARIKEPTKKKVLDKPCETIHWKDTEQYKRRQSYTEETLAAVENFEADTDSSSYSEEDQSSTSTELCDEPGRLSDFDSEEKVSDIEAKKHEDSQEAKEDVTKIEEIKCEIEDLISDITISALQTEETSSKNTNNYSAIDNLNFEEYTFLHPEEPCSTSIENKYTPLSSNLLSFLNEDTTSTNKENTNTNILASNSSDSCFSKEDDICLYVSSYSKEENTNVKQDNLTPTTTKEDTSIKFLSSNLSSDKPCFTNQEASYNSSYFKEDMLTPVKEEIVTSTTTKEDDSIKYLSSNLSSDNTCFTNQEDNYNSSYFKQDIIKPVKEEIVTPTNIEENASKIFLSSNLSSDNTCFTNQKVSYNSSYFKEDLITPVKEEMVTPTNIEEDSTKLCLSSNISGDKICFTNQEDNYNSSYFKQDIIKPVKEEIVTPTNIEENASKIFVSSNISGDKIGFTNQEDKYNSSYFKDMITPVKEEMVTPTNIEEDSTKLCLSSNISGDKICFTNQEDNYNSSYFKEDIIKPVKEEMVTPTNIEENASKIFLSSNLSSDKMSFTNQEDSYKSSYFKEDMITPVKEEMVTPTNIKEDTSKLFLSSNLSSDKICFATQEQSTISSFLLEDSITPTNKKETSISYISSFKTQLTPEEKEDQIFDSFCQERVQSQKDISSDDSQKEEQKCLELRRHKSYEESSKKSKIFKQQSFDINVVPVIETSLWKPYKIEEESPKEEIEQKKSAVDLLTVEDKRLELGRRNSERALKIIQENSMILHRILQQQKSSEVEDSEDELSRSPISKTFLRSESLLSKDERTDEDRSSKDGEEDLESGYSISPALIEEIDSKTENTLTSKNEEYGISNFISSIDPITVPKTEDNSPIASEEKTSYDIPSSILDNSKTEDLSSDTTDIKYVDTTEEYTFSSHSQNEDTFDSNYTEYKFEDYKMKYNNSEDYKFKNLTDFEELESSKYKFESSSSVVKTENVDYKPSSSTVEENDLKTLTDFENYKFDASSVVKEENFDYKSSLTTAEENNLKTLTDYKNYNFDSSVVKEENFDYKSSGTTAEENDLKTLTDYENYKLNASSVVKEENFDYKASSSTAEENDLKTLTDYENYKFDASSVVKEENFDYKRSSCTGEENDLKTLTDYENFKFDTFVVKEENFDYKPSSTTAEEMDFKTMTDYETYESSKYKFDTPSSSTVKTEHFDYKSSFSDNNTTYDRQKLSINLNPLKYEDPNISPPNLSCLQFTSFKTENPCSSKCKEKQISPENFSPLKSSKYLINLPTLSPPRRSVKSPLSPNRTFSPFPVQPTTRQPKELGVKLGIYKDLSPLKSPSK